MVPVPKSLRKSKPFVAKHTSAKLKSRIPQIEFLEKKYTQLLIIFLSST